MGLHLQFGLLWRKLKPGMCMNALYQMSIKPSNKSLLVTRSDKLPILLEQTKQFVCKFFSVPTNLFLSEIEINFIMIGFYKPSCTCSIYCCQDEIKHDQWFELMSFSWYSLVPVSIDTHLLKKLNMGRKVKPKIFACTMFRGFSWTFKHVDIFLG